MNHAKKMSITLLGSHVNTIILWDERGRKEERKKKGVGWVGGLGGGGGSILTLK